MMSLPHPKDASEPLRGRRVLLGLSGGIACYKSAELCRLLRKAGAEVRVLMSQAATRFLGPLTMHALSGNPVACETQSDDSAMRHIVLARWAEAMLFAPATADLIARLASGRANDVLALTALAREPVVPLLLAPAMNRAMWQHPASVRNRERLRRDGVEVLGVGRGEQACGEVGEGRMLEPPELMHVLRRALTPPALAGQRVLVTAGPTYEAMDPVRGLTNRSSGKMGFALAQAACEYGASVRLVAGPVARATPVGVDRVDCRSAREMAAAVADWLPETDVLVCCAAVADWRPAHPRNVKIKKESGTPVLELEPNPDILALAASSKRAREKQLFCVGFAAESDNLLAYARGKRKRKEVPLLVANLGAQAFDHEENTITLVDENGEESWERASKLALARKLMATLPERVEHWRNAATGGECP